MTDEPEFSEESIPLDESGSGIHLAHYWSIITQRWRLIALCLAGTFAVAALYCILSQRLYEAVATLDVEPERATVLDINLSVPTSNMYFAGPEFLATQARLMETREIAERVATRLNLVENREFNPPKRRDPSKPDNPLVRVAGKVKRSINAKAVREANRDTNLVELSAVATSPQLAAAIANAAADQYIEWNQETKNRVKGQASAYLGEQIQQTKAELDAKEQQLNAYRQEKDIAPGGDPSAETMYVQRLELGLDQAVADRAAKEARYRDVQNSRAEAVADTLAGGLVSQLRAEQARLEREYAEKLNLFKPDWPAMRQLKAQIDNGREHLNAVIGETVGKARETARNDYLAALRREESLKAAMKTQRSEALKLSGDAIPYKTLKLEVDAKRVLLDSLLKRQAEVEVASRMKSHESNVRVAERARPPEDPFQPSYLKAGLLALLLGGGLGVGLALLLEYLDRSLRTPEQVEQHIQLPALGVIPALGAVGASYSHFYSRKPPRKKAKSSEDEPIELLPHRHSRSLVAERYRAFRTALLLSRAGGVKSIVITSSLPREGKTATAVNLAVVLSQLGKRVLLLDADLHKPRLHEIFRLSNRTGLVSILAENVDPARMIVSTEIPDLFVVTSGPSAPNPSGLLSSEAMSQFLELARRDFDYVILDAPPVSAVADALILGNQTDGVVLCVQAGNTPRDQVARVRDRLRRSNVRILGVLINNQAEDQREYTKLYTDEKYYGERNAYTEQAPISAARIL